MIEFFGILAAGVLTIGVIFAVALGLHYGIEVFERRREMRELKAKLLMARMEEELQREARRIAELLKELR